MGSGLFRGLRFGDQNTAVGGLRLMDGGFRLWGWGRGF